MTFNSTDKNITIGVGSYGWAIHRDKTTDALIEHIESNENKVIEPIYSFRDLERSTNDIGSSYVEIDLKNQMVYVYRDGQLRVKTKTVTGNVSRGKATPTGIYPLNYKERDTVLRGEDYESPVKYWMPFNYHIGLHDADLKTEFGGDIYEKNGSNGCINLPPENTKAIFDLVYPGMPVIVH
ncbi:MAG: L,D-transpeptidase [Candidatus Methanofastidiosa archaeon]|nr:L,D-transpeptidase [Candidatus Methanofastidiosa archaeon]